MKRLMTTLCCLALTLAAHADPVSEVLADIQSGPRLSANLPKKATWALLDAKTGKSLDLSSAIKSKPDAALALVQAMAAGWLQKQTKDPVVYPNIARHLEMMQDVDVITECFGPDTTRKTFSSVVRWVSENAELVEERRTLLDHVEFNQILVWAAMYIPDLTEEMSAQERFGFVSAFQDACQEWFGPIDVAMKKYRTVKKTK